MALSPSSTDWKAKAAEMLANARADADHWQARCIEADDLLAELRVELDEFHRSSKDLEEDIQRDRNLDERRQLELRVKIARVEQERDNWKVCYAFNRFLVWHKQIAPVQIQFTSQ